MGSPVLRFASIPLRLKRLKRAPLLHFASPPLWGEVIEVPEVEKRTFPPAGGSPPPWGVLGGAAQAPPTAGQTARRDDAAVPGVDACGGWAEPTRGGVRGRGKAPTGHANEEVC